MKIAIVYRGSLSNLSDYLEHSRNLISENHSVSLYLREAKKELVPGANIIEIKKKSRIQILDRALFDIESARHISKSKIDHVICSYGRGVFLFGLLMWVFRFLKIWSGTTYYDLRSGSVSGKFDRLKDYGHRIESKFFDKKIVISKKVANYVLGLAGNDFLELDVGVKHKILPPATLIQNTRIKYHIRENAYVILYVGTFNNRRLDAFFSRITSIPKNVLFVLVGDGTRLAEESIRRSIKSQSLEGQVVLTGRMTYDDLPVFYAIANAGLCHIPPDAMYQFQPPTKLYEYLEYGLPIITTSTSAISEILAKNQSYPFHIIQEAGEINITNVIDDITQKKTSWPNNKATVKYWKDLTRSLVNFLSENQRGTPCQKSDANKSGCGDTQP